MKKLTSLLLLLIFGVFVIAQEEDVDIDTSQIVIPIQIGFEGETAIEDTASTLIVAEDQEAYVAYNEGIEMYSLSNYNEAIIKFNEAINLKQDMFIAFFGRGNAYLQLQEYEKALSDFKFAFDNDTISNSELSYLIGFSYYNLFNYDKALKYFEKSISLGYDDVNILYLKGVINFYNEDYNQAIDYFTRVIKEDPKHFFSYNDRASSYRMLEKYDKAIQDYSKAIEINNQMEVLYNNRASIKRLKNDYDAAIEDFDKAISINPNYYIAINNKGIALYQKGDYLNAIKEFEKAIEANKEYVYAYNNKGLAYYKLREYSNAVESYSKAIFINPDYAEAYLHRGSAKEMLRDMKGACVDWEKAIELGYTEAKDFISICSNYK